MRFASDVLFEPDRCRPLSSRQAAVNRFDGPCCDQISFSLGYAALSTLDWDDIRFFLGVARAEQFSAAAVRMGVDTATVARRINALEKSLNARLFDRRHTGCILTEAGERLFQTAQALE